MTLRTSPWPTGFPCWTDLSVPDVAAAQVFYSSVLGWGFGETDPQFGGYVIAEVKDTAAAGIGPQQMEGQPSAWTLYFATDDADKTQAAVTENGGTVIVPVGDVGPMGRMFIATDPTGAPFGVWQALGMIGNGIVNEPGGLSWEDLRTTDPDAARAFYGAVFGHVSSPMPGAPDDYQTFSQAAGEPPLGGMGGFMGPVAEAPHWVPYFGVVDAAAAVVACEVAGGSVATPAFDTPFGSMAGLVDPFGAVFWVAQTDGTGSPDRSS